MRTVEERRRFEAFKAAVVAWHEANGDVFLLTTNGQLELVEQYLAIKANMVSNTHSFTYSLTHYYSLTYSLILLLN
jgi:hypothetical protein